MEGKEKNTGLKRPTYSITKRTANIIRSQCKCFILLKFQMIINTIFNYFYAIYHFGTDLVCDKLQVVQNIGKGIGFMNSEDNFVRGFINGLAIEVAFIIFVVLVTLVI